MFQAHPSPTPDRQKPKAIAPLLASSALTSIFKTGPHPSKLWKSVFHLVDSCAQNNNFAISPSHNILKHSKLSIYCCNVLRVLYMMFEVSNIIESVSIEVNTRFFFIPFNQQFWAEVPRCQIAKMPECREALSKVMYICQSSLISPELKHVI